MAEEATGNEVDEEEHMGALDFATPALSQRRVNEWDIFKGLQRDAKTDILEWWKAQAVTLP